MLILIQRRANTDSLTAGIGEEPEGSFPQQELDTGPELFTEEEDAVFRIEEEGPSPTSPTFPPRIEQGTAQGGQRRGEEGSREGTEERGGTRGEASDRPTSPRRVEDRPSPPQNVAPVRSDPLRVKCHQCGSLFGGPSSNPDCTEFNSGDPEQVINTQRPNSLPTPCTQAAYCQEGEACLLYSWQQSDTQTSHIR